MAENTYKQPEKSKRKKKKKSNKSTKIFSFFKDPRLHLTFGLFLIVFGLSLFIAFTSYLFNGKADQSVVGAWGDETLQEVAPEVQNWLGVLGASMAYLFIFRWFGVASYLFIPLLILSGIKILFKREIKYLKSLFKISVFSLFWLSVLLGYMVLISKQRIELEYLCGGIGYSMASYANSLVGWGTVLVLILIPVIFVIYFFDIKTLVKEGKLAIVTSKSVSTNNDDEKNKTVEVDEDSNFANEVGQIKGSYHEEEMESDQQEVELQEDVIQENIDKGDQLELDASVEPVEELTNKDTELELAISEPEGDEEIAIDKVDPEPPLEVGEQKEETPVDVDELGEYDPKLDLPHYKYPTLECLKDYSNSDVKVTREELEANKNNIVQTLKNYKIGISSIKATIGPTVTLYEIIPEAGIKISKIKNLEDDIALSLAALGIRIIAPIPGKGTIGIEVPNKNREMVAMRSVVATEKFINTKKELPVVLGKTISNEVFEIDLAKMPHLLMAGATGQGKSVGINVILSSLLFKKHPSQLKFVLVDPKKVELSIYSKIERHFLAMLPNGEEAIITDTRKVIHTLNSLCIEMDQRYDLLKEAGCRNLKEYNKKFVERKLNPLKGHRFMPYIVLIIDELADLMMTAGKEVETPIARLAQLARAIGIHLVIATQRPSVNVITGTIKANFPARLSFKVTSKIDSRTILDAGGAEQLIGMGDMLFSQGSDLTRLQCAFIDTPEVENMVDFIGEQQGYDSAFMLPEYVDENLEGQASVDLSDRDTMFEEAARTIVAHQQGSTSLIQRKLKLGYNRAGRIIDQLEAAGIVGPFEGSKAREVLIKDEYALEQLLSELNGKTS